jgi:hypothetical protein
MHYNHFRAGIGNDATDPPLTARFHVLLHGIQIYLFLFKEFLVEFVLKRISSRLTLIGGYSESRPKIFKSKAY